MNPRTVGRFFRTLFYSLLISPLPFFHAPTIAHAAQTPIIGEVMWAGSSLSSADEWLELWNDSDEPLALAGFVLHGATPSDIVFDETQTIPARGTFLIANYAQDDLKTTVATSVQLVTTAVSLSNSALKIELLAPDGTVIDTAGDGNIPPAGSSLPSKTSMIRALDKSWISATSSMNLDEGITDFATPGFCDACGVPVISEPIPEPIIEIVIETPTTTEPIISAEGGSASGGETPTTTEPMIEVTTGTEPIVEVVAPTSTEPVLEPLVGTSSTIETILTTSTIELPIQQPAPTTIVTTSAAASSPTTTYVVPLDLHLQTIFPAPESGDEWIELQVPTGTTVAQAENWSLHDAASSIFRFAIVNERVTVNGNIWHISLASARLNNIGDTVELVRPDGSVAERMIFPTTPRGTSWIKNADSTAWIQDPPPTTVVTTNVVAASPASAQSTIVFLPPPTIELPIVPGTTTQIETTNDAPTKFITTTITTTKPKTSAAKSISTAKPKATTTKSAITTKPKTTTVKKVTTTKVDPIPPLVTIDMLAQLEPEIRVTLEGTVGTIPGILSKNQFTLHTPDGRGLLVHGSSKQTSPEFGSKVRLTGTLSLNDDGLSLKMLTKDKWVKIDGTESIQTRLVDLLAPSQEDAWSLIQITGTVLDTGSGRVNLELGGVPITAKIRPATGYRAERLSKGDTVRITGIVDTRGEEPLLYPRQTSEIEIIAHAKLASAGTSQTSLPAWTPFGAAGITVAITEGYKRLRRLTKERKLKKLAALAQ